MSSVVISGDTSGAITVAAPAVAGTNTITLPALTGTAVIAGQNSAITNSTAVALTTQTSIDFTVPSWVKRITVMFSGLTNNGTSIAQIQLGDAGGIETSGYVGGATRVDGTIASATYSAGYLMSNQQAASVAFSGQWVISKFDGNTWVENHMITETGDASNIGGGYKTLSDTLTTVRITTVLGTSLFNAGSINILYE
jgi:hypothetical protein